MVFFQNFNFASDSKCVLESLPGKLDIKRRETGILFISLPIGSLFKQAIMTLLSIFVGSASLTSPFKSATSS